MKTATIRIVAATTTLNHKFGYESLFTEGKYRIAG